MGKPTAAQRPKRKTGRAAAGINPPRSLSKIRPLRVLAFVLAFALVQVWEVVGGDVRMTDIQADILLKRRGSGAADAFDLGVAASARQTTRWPSDYGRVSDIGKDQP